MAAFFILSTFIIWAMFAATGLWLLSCFPTLGKFHPVGLLPVVGTILVLAGLTLTRHQYNFFTEVLYYVSYILFGFIFIAFCVTLGFALLSWVFKILHLPLQMYLGTASICTLFTLFGLAVWGGFSAPKIKHIYIKIPGAPNLTAAVISDAHLGTGVSLARWKKALTRLQAQQPDIIFVLGDLFEYGANAQAYADALAAVQTPLGTFGVLGNHEYYVGLQNSIDFYKQAGIKLLNNQLQTLPNGVQIIGVKDIQTARVTAAELNALLSQTNPSAPRFLLSHQPLLTDTAAAHHIPLMFSGHTHAGQIWPFHYLVKLKYPFVYGLYKTGPQSQLYVTSGMFYWGIPLRLFAPAEIPLIHIQGYD